MSMIEYPNQRIAEAGECDVCGTKMPAGWRVVPLGDDQVACSSSCVGAVGEPSESKAGDALRAEAEEKTEEADSLREQADGLEWDAEQLIKKAEAMDRQAEKIVSGARRCIPMTGKFHQYQGVA